jgi:hypothetical protein
MLPIALPLSKLDIPLVTSTGSEITGELPESSGSFPAACPLPFAVFFVSVTKIWSAQPDQKKKEQEKKHDAINFKVLTDCLHKAHTHICMAN